MSSVFDFPVLAIILFVVAMATIISAVILYHFYQIDMIQQYGPAKQLVIETRNIYNSMNFWFVFLFSGIIISTFISAYFIQSHPVFFVLNIMFLILMIFLAALITNIFNKFASNAELAPVINNFDIMVGFFQNLPKILFIAGAGIFIVMFAKWSRTRGDSDGPIR